MHALILVVITVIRTPLGVISEKIYHLVLVKREIAGIFLGIFVVFIELAALAACLMLISVFRKIHKVLPLDNGAVYDVLSVYPLYTVRALKRHEKHSVAVNTYTVVNTLEKGYRTRVKA